jgi:hemoglobin
MTEISIFEQLGGAPAVRAAAELFYRNVLADPTISGYFDAVDMDAQVAKQTAFLTMVLGGPNSYTGKDLRSAHARLPGLDDAHFDAVIRHLESTLTDLGVAKEPVAQVITIAESVRGDVLNR